MSKANYYPTWKEASVAAISLGIHNVIEYKQRYRSDPRLHHYPPRYYINFPGWKKFLDREFYKTWQAAGEAAQRLRITNRDQYLGKYDQDFRLPSAPSTVYADFPGWKKFLNIGLYDSWQQASKMVQALEISSQTDYESKHDKEPRLPASPDTFYTDFPGWREFLGKTYYETWQEAGGAAISIGINSKRAYDKKHKVDLKLPVSPRQYYPDFPGWGKFLATGNSHRNRDKCYPTWQEAAEAASILGIKNSSQYSKMYQTDPKLPSSPITFYQDLSDWTIFFGKKKKNLYPDWQEASVAAINLGIQTGEDYKEKRNGDPRLPARPDITYKNFPGFRKFLGKKD